MLDPGFDYCGLGDVNNDGRVDSNDIFAVVKAENAFSKTGVVDSRADLHKDQQITRFDVDVITDVVTLPPLQILPIGQFEPAVGQEDIAESIRALAPFEAICRSARGKYSIQTPVEEQLLPRTEVCARAKEIGCQVIDCPQ